MKSKYYNRNKSQFKQAQKNGKYRIFYFDVIGSRKIYANNPKELDEKLSQLVDSVTKRILKVEKKEENKIFHRHIENMSEELANNFESLKSKVILCKKQSAKSKDLKGVLLGKINDQFNPLFTKGDAVYFIVLENSISPEAFYDLFEKEKQKIAPNYNFRKISGLYEKDEFKYQDDKLSRTYCLAILEELINYKKNKTMSKR